MSTPTTITSTHNKNKKQQHNTDNDKGKQEDLLSFSPSPVSFSPVAKPGLHDAGDGGDDDNDDDLGFSPVRKAVKNIQTHDSIHHLRSNKRGLEGVNVILLCTPKMYQSVAKLTVRLLQDNYTQLQDSDDALFNVNVFGNSNPAGLKFLHKIFKEGFLKVGSILCADIDGSDMSEYDVKYNQIDGARLTFAINKGKIELITHSYPQYLLDVNHMLRLPEHSVSCIAGRVFSVGALTPRSTVLVKLKTKNNFIIHLDLEDSVAQGVSAARDALTDKMVYLDWATLNMDTATNILHLTLDLDVDLSGDSIPKISLASLPVPPSLNLMSKTPIKKEKTSNTRTYHSPRKSKRKKYSNTE